MLGRILNLLWRGLVAIGAVLGVTRRAPPVLTPALRIIRGREAPPFDCPVCNSRIIREEDAWICVGLEGREEIERYLLPHVPAGFQESIRKNVTKIEACGWRGRHADHGSKWL